jgi:hypothetical protein
MSEKELTTMMIRQGDVVLRRIETPNIPLEPVKSHRLMVKTGEITGHNHVVVGVQTKGLWDGKQVFVVGEGAFLHHGTLAQLAQAENLGADRLLTAQQAAVAGEETVVEAPEHLAHPLEAGTYVFVDQVEPDPTEGIRSVID